MLIVLTGAIGTGKTTVCQKIVDIARSRGCSCGGAITYKSADGGIIIEDVKTGQKQVLASLSDVFRGPHVGRYYFDPAGIDFGAGAIAVGAASSILVVDEVGPLELTGRGFTGAIELIKAQKFNHCIIVIRKELLPIFGPELGVTPLLFETTAENRDSLPAKIVDCILEQ